MKGCSINRWMGMVLMVAFVASIGNAKESTPDMPAPPPPPLPAISAIKLMPETLTISDGRDARRVIVLGITASGKPVDLTGVAQFQSDSKAIEVGADGYIRGKEKGTAEVSVHAANLQAKLPVNVANVEIPKIGFVRDVQPILARVGCNAGTCHGSAKGKEGFKLSLRGYDSEFDYGALINDLGGRRFNRVDPAGSLMLQKPAGQVPHEGGKVLAPGTEYYETIKKWIAEGTKDQEPEARAIGLEVLPDDVYLDLPGRSQQMLVIAHYKDGSSRDVTREAIYSSSNIEVAAVKDNNVTALRRGEGAVLIRYEGNYATRQVICMGDRTGYAWAEQPAYNYIDNHVYEKLKMMKILPSELCTDAEFIRRVSLDLTGQPPTAEKVKAFLADPADSKSKREALVDEYLVSEGYNDYWSNKWADLLQCNSKNLGQKSLWTFRGWIRNQIAHNVPYDEFVKTLLLAKGSSYTAPEVNYYRALGETGKITEDVSQTFLGVRFNCNKCHDHPFEKWTQNQYYQFGAFFARITMKKGQGPDEQVVYNNYNGGEVNHPKTAAVVKPHVPYGMAHETMGDEDRRVAFVEWMTSAQNPYFAKSMSNRVWSYFFGRGIIDPVDDIRASNPASNAPLLDALTEDFVKQGFDVRKLMRTICTSRTYQLAINTNRWNEDDKINFSHALPRRLGAEQLVDAVAVATGYRASYGGMPQGTRAVMLPDGTGETSDVLGLFGKPKRQSACECERTSNFTLSHAINLVNGSTIGDAVAKGSRIKEIVEANKDDRKVVEELYFTILNRPPMQKELEGISLGEKRMENAQDIAWALLNSPAFLYNR
jgi:hypothetical protein